MTESIRQRTRKEGSAAEDDAHNAPSPKPVASSLDANTSQPTAQSSSFFALPTVVVTGPGTSLFHSILGQHIYDLIARRITGGAASHTLECLLTATDGVAFHARAVLRESVFKTGTTRSAIPDFAAAIVFNHARRTIWFGQPAVGFFLLPTPDDDWRLLLARPDVFLEDVVKAARGGRYLHAILFKLLWDLVAGGATALLVTADDSKLLQVIPPNLRSTPRGKAVARTLVRRTKDIAAALFIVWLFSCIEYAVAQSSSVLATGYAVWMILAVPGKGGLDLLVKILFGGNLSTTFWTLFFLWTQLVVYSWKGLVPLVGRSFANPVRQPGLLLSIVFSVVMMDTLLRYRSKLYLAIETSGFFFFLGYAVISAMMVAAGRKKGVGKKTS